MPRSGTDPSLVTPHVLPGGDAATSGGRDPHEATLVARARGGDLQAWSRLYQDCFDTVYRHVCFLTGDATAAEDLTQDVFARAMVAIADFDGRAPLVAWLRGIALNVTRMHWRRSKTKDRVYDQVRQIELVASDGHGDAPDARHLRSQRMAVVYEILGTLPERQREAFVLRDLEGIAAEAAAQLLGISAGNVAVRASRARAKIRSELKRRGWLSGGGR